MSEDRVAVGYISRTKGVKGWVAVEPLTDDPERFGALKKVHVEVDAQPPRVVRIKAWRIEGRSVLLKFGGINTPEAARDQVVKGYVTIPREQVASLPAGQHYVFDLVGCRVVDGEEVRLGDVTDVLPMPSSDVLVVRQPVGGEVMIPMVGDFVVAVDTKARRIQVHGVEELFED